LSGLGDSRLWLTKEQDLIERKFKETGKHIYSIEYKESISL
jgi:hypothetical protein